MSKIIKFYRHGETEWNKVGRLQGWQDSPLTQYGIQAAQAVDWQPDRVFSSDLLRAYTTAKWMFPCAEIHQDARLREINLGNWQGQYISDLQHTDAYKSYLNAPENFLATTQESFQHVTARMLSFIDELEQLPVEKIAIVSHGVAIACLVCYLKQQPVNDLWQFMLPSGGCVQFIK